MYWGAAPNPDAPRVSLNPPDPLSKGAIRACGLSIAAVPALPANSGPASDDALLILRSDFFAMLCRCCPKTRRSAGPLRPPRICCSNGVGKIDSFAYVVGFTCAVPAFLPSSSFIDIVPNCGPNCVKSPLSSGASQFAAGYAAVRRAASPDSI